MKDIVHEIKYYEFIAGLQYAILESYSVSLSEQLKATYNKNESERKPLIKKTLIEVSECQSEALKAWQDINIILDKLCLKQYKMSYVEFQWTSKSIARTKLYKDTIESFKKKMIEIQTMAFHGIKGKEDKFNDMIESLYDILPDEYFETSGEPVKLFIDVYLNHDED